MVCEELRELYKCLVSYNVCRSHDLYQFQWPKGWYNQFTWFMPIHASFSQILRKKIIICYCSLWFSQFRGKCTFLQTRLGEIPCFYEVLIYILVKWNTWGWNALPKDTPSKQRCPSVDRGETLYLSKNAPSGDWTRATGSGYCNALRSNHRATFLSMLWHTWHISHFVCHAVFIRYFSLYLYPLH